ncbi:phage baseplate assembly protein V [Zooshikella sp. RANM57]|uniref:phage baseplate assembly protein V n=1 Tax=Zooshikella sp. RANM57 TaxID=3425863 RepID=UPI003D6F3A4A
MQSFQVSEIDRLLHNLFRVCTVVEQRTDGRVKVTDGELVSAWLDRGVLRAGGNVDWSPLDEGEQVLVACPSGDFAQGVVVCSLYQLSCRPSINDLNIECKRFLDGSVVSYDRQKHHFSLNLAAGATVAMVASGGFSLVGDVDIAGSVRVGGKITSIGDQVAGSISQINHVHKGVQSGPSKTDKPE